MPILKVTDGQVVSYDEYGAGPGLMLVHGSPGSSNAWQPVGQRLSDRFRIVAPNLPGYGGTSLEEPGGVEGVPHAAALLEAVMRETGVPDVLAGHSYGGVVTLAVALRGRVRPKALALFEPVCIPILLSVGDAQAFADMKSLLDDYIRAYEDGDLQAARTMVDFWFGRGAYQQLPGPVRDFIVKHTGSNVHDVRASFRERYAPDAMRKLDMPVWIVYGSKSPDVSYRVASTLAAMALKGSLVKVDGATHALTATHSREVAELIATLATQCAEEGQPEKV
jgi:pimeloyl-ACP methyl ester carboxylesterase